MYNKSLLSASIILALTSTAHAEDYALFDEVVVSATRTNQQLDDVAASVTVISDEDIEKSIATDVDDIFKYTPGVTVQSDSRQGVQSVNVRGLEGNRVKIIVDGVSQANQFQNEYAFINSGRVDVDMDLLKSVEIVKGAASSLQGADAVGGIVAFETKNPSDFLNGEDFGGHAKFGFSSADSTFTESVALANKFGDTETLIAYTRKDGGELDNFGQTPPNDNKADNVLAKLQYQINEQHRIEFSGEYVDKKSTSDFTNSNRNSSGTYTSYLGDDTDTKTRIGVKHIWSIDSGFADEVEWQLDYLSKEAIGITDRTSPTNVQKKNYSYKDSGLQFGSQFDKHIITGSTEHFIVYGLSYSDKDISNTNNEYNSSSADKVIYYMPDAKEQKLGIFLQDEIVVNNNFILTPGLRYDRYVTKANGGIEASNGGGYDETSYADYSDSSVTARLGALWSTDDNNKIFAQVSQGFRAPDFQELYYSYAGSHGPISYVSVPNPNLKAEESISYELGWRFNDGTIKNEIAVFYSDYDNFIADTVDMTGNPWEYSHENLDKAKIKGIELSNIVHLDELIGAPVGTTSNIAATYTEGKDGENKPLDSVMPWSIVLGLSYDAPSSLWGTSLQTVYTASKDKSDINHEPGDTVFEPNSSFVVDLTAYYRPISDLTLRAGLFNATDEEYYNWSDIRGSETEDKFYTQAGRNWSVTAKYEF